MELLKDIVKKLEDKYPSTLMEEWDNVGLMIESENQEIKNVMIVLDVTTEVIDEAIEKHVDLIISHHPLIFTAKDVIRNVTYDTVLGKKIIKLIKNDIAVYSMHTNLDIAEDGMNDYIMKKIDAINVMRTENEPCMRCGNLKESMNAIELADYVKEKLDNESVCLIARDDNKKISKIAVITGSGSSGIDYARNLGVDAYITGDIKYSNAVRLIEEDMIVVDAGHYGTEKIVRDIISNYLKDIKLDVNIIESTKMKNPMRVR